MIADIVAYLFCNDVALVSVCYSYLGFTFTSSPGTGKPGKAQQTHTIDTLRYNIIMEFTFQTNHPESGMTTLLFHVMLRWPANVFFWGANPPKFHWRILKASFPSAVQPPTLGVHRWGASPCGWSGLARKQPWNACRLWVQTDGGQVGKESTAEILKRPLGQIMFLERGMGQ